MSKLDKLIAYAKAFGFNTEVRVRAKQVEFDRQLALEKAERLDTITKQVFYPSGLSFDHIIEARRMLDEQNIPANKVQLVMSHEQYYELLKETIIGSQLIHNAMDNKRTQIMGIELCVEHGMPTNGMTLRATKSPLIQEFIEIGSDGGLKSTPLRF